MHTHELAAAKLKSIAGASPDRPVAIPAGELRQLCEAVQASPLKASPGPAEAFAGYDASPGPTEA